MCRKFKNPKIAYAFDKTLVLSVISDKCGSKGKTYLKKENQLRYCLISNYFKDKHG